MIMKAWSTAITESAIVEWQLESFAEKKNTGCSDYTKFYYRNEKLLFK